MPCHVVPCPFKSRRIDKIDSETHAVGLRPFGHTLMLLLTHAHVFCTLRPTAIPCMRTDVDVAAPLSVRKLPRLSHDRVGAPPLVTRTPNSQQAVKFKDKRVHPHPFSTGHACPLVVLAVVITFSATCCSRHDILNAWKKSLF